MTARTAPPAITPAPGAAGFMQHLAGAMLADDLVRNRRAGQRDADHVATRPSTALRTASETSFALPVAKPTFPCPSPTATSALKREATTALHDLGHAVDRDHVLDEIAPLTRSCCPPRPPRESRPPRPRRRTAATTATRAATAATRATAPAARAAATATRAATSAARTTTTAATGATAAAVHCGPDRSPALHRSHSSVQPYQNSSPPSRAPSATAFTRP